MKKIYKHFDHFSDCCASNYRCRNSCEFSLITPFSACQYGNHQLVGKMLKWKCLVQLQESSDLESYQTGTSNIEDIITLSGSMRASAYYSVACNEELVGNLQWNSRAGSVEQILVLVVQLVVQNNSSTVSTNAPYLIF